MGRIIVQYLVRGAYYAHVGSGTASPKNWKMQGSDNASDWTDLDTVTNETGWGDQEERVFTMDDTGEYQYYRLNCTLNNGNTHYVCLSEIELREELGGANVCTALTSNSAPEPYTADQSSALAGLEAFKAWNAYDQNDADPGQWCSAAVPSVETPQWCYYNFATDEPPAAVIQGPRLVSAKSIFHKLGDNAGANKYVLQDSDDVEVFSVDSDGHIAAPSDDLDPATKKYVDDQVPGSASSNACHAYLAANQDNIANATWVKVGLDSVVFNHGTAFDTTDERYECPVNGVYLVIGNVVWSGAGGIVANERYSSSIFVDGANAADSFSQAAVNNEPLSSPVSCILNLTAGQYIELYCRHSAGAATPDVVGVQTYYTRMCVCKLYAT